MSLRDFILLVGISIVWALNMVGSKIVVGDLGVPPLFYAAVRTALIAVAVLPWLLPMPRPRWRIVAIGLLMGGGGFALLFVGLATATPSAAAVVTQLGIPMVTVLSIVMLGERIRWRRALGIALAFGGIVVVMWEPGGFALSTGLLFVAASAFASSLGAVMMKQVSGVRPLQLQAWVGFASAPLLGALSFGLETDQAARAIVAGWPFVGIVLFSALVVSVMAHTAYYGLIQRYEANLLAPLTLMSPLFSVALGVAVTGDPFGVRMAVGTALALAGVLVVAIRGNRTAPEALLIRQRV